MTNRCFSNSQLYALRNEINVQMLIEKTLRIPCRVTKGCFRFLCPLCNGFDTAVNPKTNLARCFACEKNFNTIDLVMLVRQTDFVQSVKFLQSILQNDSACSEPDDHWVIPGSNPQDGSRSKHRTLSGKSDDGPCRIGKILGSVLPPDEGGILEKRVAEYKPEKPIAALEKADEDRIVKLERQLKNLGRQVQKLTRAINAGRPSK
jgi:hypothetical protein